MPRVAGIYSRPTGIDAVANNTIDSGKYNSNVADVEADLNLPRPIVAGGTGATNVTQARDNLDAEVAGTQVTDYSTHVFENGSFYSDHNTPDAPNPSDPTRYYVGTARLLGSNPTQYITLDVRSSDSASPALAYTRQKIAGVWQAWVAAGSAMSSGLTISADPGFLAIDDITPDANNPAINMASGGTLRWQIVASDNLLFHRYDNSAVYAGTPMMIDRTTGLVSINTAPGATSLSLSGAANTTASTLHMEAGAGSRAYITFSESSVADRWAIGMDQTDGVFRFRAVDALGAPRIGIEQNGNTTFAGAVGVGIAPGSLPGVGNTNAGINLDTSGYAMFSRDIQSVVWVNLNANGQSVVFNRSGLPVGNIAVTTTATAYNTSSDARLKDDLKAFDAGNIVDDTNVYDFRWKSTGERSYGVIAQEAANVYPAPTFHDEKDDRWYIDYSRYVPVLLQEVKTLRARVARLEELAKKIEAL